MPIRRSRGQKRRLHMLMSDASLEVDNNAAIIGSQVSSDVLDGIAAPGRLLPTPSFIHRELYRAPAPSDDVQVESANIAPVEMDSQFLNVDAPQMWDGARLQLEHENDSEVTFKRWLLAVTTVVCSVFLMVSVAMAFQSGGDEPTTDQSQNPAPAPTAAPTPTPAPILPRIGN